jgi:hypothetical protein
MVTSSRLGASAGRRVEDAGGGEERVHGYARRGRAVDGGREGEGAALAGV